MKTKNIATYISLGLSVLGVGLCAFLYNYPYDKVAGVVSYRDFDRGLASLELQAQPIADIEGDDLLSYSAEFSAHLIASAEDYEDFAVRTNRRSTNFGADYFSGGRQILALGYRGRVMTYSKVTGVKVKGAVLAVDYSVENDFILDGSAKPDELVYSCDLVPVKISDVSAVEKLRITVKKV